MPDEKVVDNILGSLDKLSTIVKIILSIQIKIDDVVSKVLEVILATTRSSA